jgi:hypothetical protein
MAAEEISREIVNIPPLAPKVEFFDDGFESQAFCGSNILKFLSLHL